MIQPEPMNDVEKGTGLPSPDKDSLSLSDGLDLDKRSGEDTGRTSTENSDIEAAENQQPASRQRTRDDVPNGGDDNGVLSRAISRVLTKASTKSSWNPGPPPDGGLQAWTAGKLDPAPSLFTPSCWLTPH